MNQNPYAPPQAPGPPGQDPYANYQPPPDRGGCLTAFLILSFIGNAIVAVIYLAASDFIRRGLPNAPEWAAPVLGVLGIANFAFAVGIWKFQKWGVYGAVAISVVAFAINVIIGLPPQNIIGGLIGPGILIALVSGRWQYFK